MSACLLHELGMYPTWPHRVSGMRRWVLSQKSLSSAPFMVSGSRAHTTCTAHVLSTLGEREIELLLGTWSCG